MDKDNDKDRAGSGIGFLGALTIAFIVLKLCKIINWSWLWVLAPLWIPVVIVMILFAVIFIVLAIRGAMHKIGGGEHDAGQ